MQKIQQFKKDGSLLSREYIRRRAPLELKRLHLLVTKTFKVPWHDALSHAKINPFAHLPRTQIPLSKQVLKFLHGFVRENLLEPSAVGMEYHWKTQHPREYKAIKNWKINGKEFGGNGTWFDYVRKAHGWPSSAIEHGGKMQRGTR